MTATDGARNMLVNCASAKAGERLLIAYEPATLGYYSPEAMAAVEQAGVEIGLETSMLDVGFSGQNPVLSDALMVELERADIVVFLARLGDQLRFSEMPPNKRILVSYALDGWHFSSPFGTVNHHAMVAIKKSLDQVFSNAKLIEVSCPKGTRVSGAARQIEAPHEDTSILRFPLSVFSPLPAENFSGKVALCGFLTGTGSMYYDDYTVEFDSQVFALLVNGRLDGFEGTAADVAKAKSHYDRVSALFGIDREFVHSWHVGMHPGCGYHMAARDNYERWSGAAFGNPRLLHFHTCGAYAPGEISWNMVDPTVTADGIEIYEAGRLMIDNLPGGTEILGQYSCAAAAFANPDGAVGLADYH
jgi:hypothetical protein